MGWRERQDGGITNDHEETLGVMEMPTTLTVVMASQVYTQVNTSNCVLLKCAIYYMPIIHQ